jgi:hypothetical protein
MGLTALKGNAGNGGSAPSGSASGSSSLNSIGGTDTTGKIPVGSGFSGAGGQALGGSVDSSPALAELDSGMYNTHVAKQS